MNRPLPVHSTPLPKSHGSTRSHRFRLSLSVAGLAALIAFGVSQDVLQAQTSDPMAENAPAPVDAIPPAASEPVSPLPPDPQPPIPQPPQSIEPAPSAVAPAPSAVPNEPFIDSTDYGLGATHRTRDLPAAASAGREVQLPTASLSSVQIGPISVSNSGVGIGTLPSVKDFYRRTLPPLGRLGNGNIRLIFPLSIPAPITSVFGWRIHPISGDPRFHMGTDLGAPLGTPVLAAYAGRVAIADFLGGYGLAIALDHNKGTQQTLYGHLSEIFVKQGEWVKQGSVIGRVGSTGNSTGAHLHFEFRQLTPDGWVALDPGSQLEYALAELVKVLAVSEKGIAIAKGIPVSRQGQAGVSGEISWNLDQERNSKHSESDQPNNASIMNENVR